MAGQRLSPRLTQVVEMLEKGSDMSDRWPPSNRDEPAEREAFDVIEQFHADYDRSMRQDEALGRLLIAGAFRPGDERVETLLRVGAQMCGMIRGDVYLDTFSGKMRLLASSPDAELRHSS